MAFSRAQQPEFQRLKRAAWAVFCAASGAAPGDKSALREWYEGELEIATGQRSSTGCNVTNDYDDALAHFEALARDGITWQAKRSTANERRLDFVLQKLSKGLPAAYLDGVARRVCKKPLAELDAGDRARLIAALKIHLRRQRSAEPERGQNEPF